MDVLTILEWVAGGSVLSIISNILLFYNQQRMKKASIKLDTIKVYQDIAESNNQLLQEQNGKIVLLQKKVSHLEIIVVRVKECDYYPTCPVHKLVQDYAREFLFRNDRQPSLAKDDERHPRDDTGEPCDNGDLDGQPP